MGSRRRGRPIARRVSQLHGRWRRWRGRGWTGVARSAVAAVLTNQVCRGGGIHRVDGGQRAVVIKKLTRQVVRGAGIRGCARQLVVLRSVLGSHVVRDVARGGKHGRRGRNDLAHQHKRRIVGAECVSSNVGSLVLNWTLTGHDGLGEVAQHGEHGQTVVLDLLDLQLGESVRIISQTQRVEGFTRQQIKILTSGASLVGTVGLNSTHH